MRYRREVYGRKPRVNGILQASILCGQNIINQRGTLVGSRRKDRRGGGRTTCLPPGLACLHLPKNLFFFLLFFY